MERAQRFAVGGADGRPRSSKACGRTTPGRSRCRRTTPGSRRATRRCRRRRATAASRATSRCPAGAGKFPAVLVVHENRGLNPYIEDVARRFARRELHRVRAGWPDLGRRLSRQRRGGRGGVPQGGRRRRCSRTSSPSAGWLKAHARLHRQVRRRRLLLRRRHLESARRADARSRRRGAVLRPPGRAPKTSRRSRRRCCSTTPATTRREQGLAGVRSGAQGEQQGRSPRYIYEGTQHGFHNDTTPRYDEAAAKLAWQRTLDFFNKHLR